MKAPQKKRLKLVLLVNFLFVFTVLIFAPIEIFMSNQNDFLFSLHNFWWASVIFAMIIMAMGTIFFMILPQKIYNILITLFFSLTVLSYLQGNFLNGNLGMLNGEKPEWTGQDGLLIFNLFLWLLGIVFFFFLMLKKKKIFGNVVRIGSVFLIAVQGVALVYLLITTPIKPVSNEKLLKTGMTEISKKDNVIVFILDYFDNVYLDEVLQEKQDLLDNMEGFTRYTNVSSVYGRTFPSITYLLTQEDYRYDIPAEDYLNQAYHNDRGIAKLRNAGYQIGIYTPYEVASDMKGIADNYGKDEKSVNHKGILKGLLYVTAYRDLPMVVKPLFWFYTDDINLLSRSDETEAFVEDDTVFYKQLSSQGLQENSDDADFRFYHFYGTHPPVKYNEDMQITDDATRTSQAVGELSMLYQYFEQMKQMGTYENALIIVTADHGRVNRKGELDYAPTPILFIKERGKGTGKKMQVSDSPISHADLWSVIEEYANLPVETNQDQHTQRYFYYPLCTDDKEDELIEYEIPQDANDFSKWKKTGTEWDIQYSVYSTK